MLLELGEGFGSVSFEDIEQEEIMKIKVKPRPVHAPNPLAPNIYHLEMLRMHLVGILDLFVDLNGMIPSHGGKNLVSL
ncbi:hypothetical protein VP01_3135g2 [Puccinia sorghi]|uniref:Uncharacterized protein n=1 Tax=Puccinia sorghi TaxID=27349 RepID=A0A0L6UZ74_9BASI|nr:hypothetical protein VP01_3135g2 [Puccinia sorghi]